MQLITGLSAEGVRQWTERGHLIKLAHGVYDLPASVQRLTAKARTEGAQERRTEPTCYDLEEERARKEHYLACEAEHRLAVARGEYVPVEEAVGWIAELVTNLLAQVRGLDLPTETKGAMLAHIRDVTLPGWAREHVALESPE
jgi:phage terminase Nu1 subunit (DNA packaging protein)